MALLMTVHRQDSPFCLAVALGCGAYHMGIRGGVLDGAVACSAADFGPAGTVHDLWGAPVTVMADPFTGARYLEAIA